MKEITMSKKSKIILITVLLSVFAILMIVIVITRKPKEDTSVDIDPNYAINETRDTEEEEESTEIKTEEINNREISHLERLTPEQYAAKSEFYATLHNR